MSRSYRKTPVFGIASSQKGQKHDKQIANRKFRRKNKIISHLNTIEFNSQISGWDWAWDDFEGSISENIYYNRLREVSNVWDWAYDGKYYWNKSEIPNDIIWKIMGK